MKNTVKKIFNVFAYCSGFAFLNIIMQIAVTFPYTIVYMFFTSGTQFLSGDPNAFLAVNVDEATRSILIPVLLSSAVLTFGLAWLIHVLFKKNFFERLYFNKTTTFLVVTSFIAGLSLQIPTGDIISFFEQAGIMPNALKEYSKIIESIMTGQSFILEIIAIGIIVPILEEVIYRGLVFDKLRKNLPLSLALIIQALVFGLVHLNLVQGSYAFMLGLLMGIVLVRSQSIILSVAIHIGMNLSGVILSELQPSIGTTGELILRVASYVLAPACIILILLKTKTKAPASGMAV